MTLLPFLNDMIEPENPMDKRAIDVQILSEYRKSVDSAWVESIVSTALLLAEPKGDNGANVFIANTEILHDLNLRFRGLDESTDVLSFGQNLDEDPDITFPSLPDKEPLGDVVISLPHAQAQAKLHNVSFERELALLIVHGILHLLGHDHAEPKETATMQGLENLILDDFFAEVGT